MNFGERNEEIFKHADTVGIKKESALADVYNETAESQSEHIIHLQELLIKYKNLQQKKELKELIEATDTAEYELIVNRINALAQKITALDAEADEIDKKLNKLMSFYKNQESKQNLGIDLDVNPN